MLPSVKLLNVTLLSNESGSIKERTQTTTWQLIGHCPFRCYLWRSAWQGGVPEVAMHKSGN